MSLLTVVIPCLNRHQMLNACIDSIDSKVRDDVQLVIVDDGSSPSLAGSVSSKLRRGDLLIRQDNRGRAAALRNGVLAAGGCFVLIMDSDDEFVPGALSTVVDELHQLSDKHVGVVYECRDFHSSKSISALPDGVTASLLSLRADYGVVGDLKEIVRRDVLLGSLYPDPAEERRVPTSYIWAGVSYHGPVLSRAFQVVRHRYLVGGMSHNIETLKKRNPFWLARTYLKVAVAPPDVYLSKTFRFKSLIKAVSVDGARFTTDEVKLLRGAMGPSALRFAACLAKGHSLWGSFRSFLRKAA